MKNLTIARYAATGLAVASIGVASLMAKSEAVNLADGCGDGWYWNGNTNTCVPNGFPSDPPNGCLNASGSHLNGNICVN
jgi:hypothetical protein